MGFAWAFVAAAGADAEGGAGVLPVWATARCPCSASNGRQSNEHTTSFIKILALFRTLFPHRQNFGASYGTV
jgi:hypothetical protein